MSNAFALSGPRLPRELEHRAFQIAALAHPRRIPILMLVARRVKVWIEPLMYRVVFLRATTIGEPDNLGLPFFAADALEQRSHLWLQHVRYLLIDDAFVQGKALQSWLLACTSVTNLCALLRCSSAILSAVSSFTNIQYLTIDVRVLCGRTLPFLFTVTHLDLLHFGGVGQDDVTRMVRNISLMPRLTHIALNSRLDELLSHAALCAIAKLQCIVFFNAVAPLAVSPLLDDPRSVCIDDGGTYYTDWLRAAVFGEDYWSFADAFLAARQAGTIDRSQYHIINGKDFQFMKGDSVSH
ncbi:hypothetical protein C8R45DRAFT_986295 [Mycena sanguinolenta]|nr:hypothetical protein C8R45DRAFT_986295 [Mycena sanguinolenta]